MLRTFRILGVEIPVENLPASMKNIDACFTRRVTNGSTVLAKIRTVIPRAIKLMNMILKIEKQKKRNYET